MTLPDLFAYYRNVTTPFGLLGNDENALSFALGYTFRACPRFLQHFLSEIGIGGVRANSLGKARIDLQKHRGGLRHEGITDLEIHLPGVLHVIVEAKIGMSIPTLEQCVRYVPRFRISNEPNQRLVALVESPDKSFVSRYESQDAGLHGRLVAFNWVDFVPTCIQLMSAFNEASQAGTCIRWFYSFLDKEYQMKTFTTEVWILPASTEPLWPDGWSFLDTHLRRRVYYDQRRHSVRPLYIGFRANGKLEALHRVLGIEHETPPIAYVPELENVPEEWPKTPYTIWHLDGPIPLPKPIPTGGSLWQRDVRCDMDVLLTSQSVKEIEDRMRERRSSTQ